MKIFTIGYEGVTQTELIATLQAAGVRRLVDVRAVPLSRRPGFSKNILAAGLREAGIDYVGLKALGTPAEGREAARKGQHARLATIYARQLDLPEAIVQAEQLKDMAAQTPVALLCFERDPSGCHRSLLLDTILPDADRVDLFPGERRRSKRQGAGAHYHGNGFHEFPPDPAGCRSGSKIIILSAARIDGFCYT